MAQSNNDAGKLAVLAFQNLLGVAIDKLEPIAVDAGLAKIRSTLDGQAAKVAHHQDQHGWGGGKIGDQKNDWPGDAIAKQADDSLFVLAMGLPGDASDWFRDHVSPMCTPNARVRLSDTSTSLEIVQAEFDELYGFIEGIVRGATGVAAP